VLLIDLPQFGKSAPVVIDEPRGVYYARLVNSFLDALGIEKVHVLGHSMGGSAGLKLAVDYPERVDRLMVIAPHIGVPSSFAPMPSEGIKRLNEVFANPTTTAIHEMMKVLVYDASFVTEKLLEQRLQATKNDAMLEARRKSYAGLYDITPELPKIKAKTLLLWGREDRFIPIDFALTLLARIPAAELHVFPRCGHWVQFDARDAFNHLVVDWLTNP
jgi:pimeloyl-ACP methyl ester carboxylesterase